MTAPKRRWIAIGILVITACQFVAWAASNPYAAMAMVACLLGVTLIVDVLVAGRLLFAKLLQKSNR
jgi:hypothetical protein